MTEGWGSRSWGRMTVKLSTGTLWRPCFEYGPYPTYSNYCPTSQVKGNAVQPVEMFQLSTCHTMFSKSCRSQSCTIPRLWHLQPPGDKHTELLLAWPAWWIHSMHMGCKVQACRVERLHHLEVTKLIVARHWRIEDYPAGSVFFSASGTLRRSMCLRVTSDR